jgi:hypothetical protein
VLLLALPLPLRLLSLRKAAVVGFIVARRMKEYSKESLMSPSLALSAAMSVHSAGAAAAAAVLALFDRCTALPVHAGHALATAGLPSR